MRIINEHTCISLIIDNKKEINGRSDFCSQTSDLRCCCHVTDHANAYIHASHSILSVAETTFRKITSRLLDASSPDPLAS